MVKSKSNKMHLEINNDLELDVNNASISRRIKKSKKTSSSPIKRIKKVSNNLKSRKRISSTNAKMLAKKKRSSKRITAKRASALKAKKPLMPSTIINGKRVPLKAAMKMSSAPKTSSASRKSASRREASGRNVSDSRRNASFSRRRASDVRRKASDARRKASASRRMSSDKRPKPAHPKNWRQGTGPAKMPSSGNGKALPKNQQKSLKAKSGRSKALKQAKHMSVAEEKAGKSSTVSSGPIEKVKEFWSNLTSSSDSNDEETALAAEAEDRNIQKRKEPVTNKENSATASKSEGSSNETKTIYMPIEQSSSSNGKTAEAIILKKDDVDVKDVKIIKKIVDSFNSCICKICKFRKVLEKSL